MQRNYALLKSIGFQLAKKDVRTACSWTVDGKKREKLMEPQVSVFPKTLLPRIHLAFYFCKMRRPKFTPSFKRRFPQLFIIHYLVQTLSFLAHRVNLEMQYIPRRPAIAPTPGQFVDLATPVPAGLPGHGSCSSPWQQCGRRRGAGGSWCGR